MKFYLLYSYRHSCKGEDSVWVPISWDRRTPRQSFLLPACWEVPQDVERMWVESK